MNNQYISFWQNAFTDALNLDKQAENINNIVTHTLSQFEEISSSFSNLSSDNYKKSLNDYIKLFGLVSTEEYSALIEKYEKLKKEKQTTESNKKTQNTKVATLNKTIKSQKEEVATQAKTIKSQKEEAATQAKTIIAQKNDLDKTKKESASFKAELANQQKTITLLEKKLAGVPTKNAAWPKTKK